MVANESGGPFHSCLHSVSYFPGDFGPQTEPLPTRAKICLALRHGTRVLNRTRTHGHIAEGKRPLTHNTHTHTQSHLFSTCCSILLAARCVPLYAAIAGLRALRLATLCLPFVHTPCRTPHMAARTLPLIIYLHVQAPTRAQQSKPRAAPLNCCWHQAPCTLPAPHTRLWVPYAGFAGLEGFWTATPWTASHVIPHSQQSNGLLATQPPQDGAPLTFPHSPSTNGSRL